MAYIVIIRYKHRCETREDVEALLREAGDFNDAVVVRVGGGE